MGRTAIMRSRPPAAPAQQSAKGVHVVPFQTPWNGYTPDLAVPTKHYNGLTDCQAVVASSGILTTDHGWSQVGSATLPLGHTTGALGFTDSAANTYGQGLVACSAAQAQPIKHLASLQRFTSSSGLGVAEIMAITADKGGAAGANQESGHLFRFSGGAWNRVEFGSNNGIGGGAAVASSVPLTGSTGVWYDSAVYTLGVTGGMVGANTIRSVAESVFLFTNYNDQVMYYPDITGGSSYTDFRSYANQVNNCGLTPATYYSGASTIFTGLRAKTLCVFDGRAWYGNTVEGSNYYATRLRRSIVGNPLIVWPGFEMENTPTSLALNGVGSGYIDLDQFKTPIQRILPLGDVLAVYSEDGIAFLRRSGNNISPYAVQYITLERGLLASGGVVSINPAQHFAILNDGWYIISANGSIQEVGTASSGSPYAGAPNNTVEVNYKWKSDFYTRINGTAIGQGILQTGYDSTEQLVRIAVALDGGTTFTDTAAVAFTTANEVWLYDLKNDRVWLDNYDPVGTRNENPLCWSTVSANIGTIVSWADITAGAAEPWNAKTDGGSWNTVTPAYSGSAVTHGDLNGYVYGHSPNIITRDTQSVPWSFTTAAHNLKSPGAGERMVQRIDVEYQNNQSNTDANIVVNVYGYSNDSGDMTTAITSEAGSINVQRGNGGEMAQSYAHFRTVGDHHQISMSGVGKPLIHSIDVELQILQGRYRRREGT